MKIIYLALLASLPAWAEGKPDFQVEVNPQVYQPKEFAAPGVKARAMPPRQARPDAVPNRAAREEAFGRVPGLAADIAPLDEMDRDILYVRAKTRSLQDLAKLYPKMDQKKLARLRKEVKRAPKEAP